MAKNLPANAGDVGSSWIRKIPRRKEVAASVFLPKEINGQEADVLYSPWVT